MNSHIDFVYVIQFKAQGTWFFSVIEPNRYNVFEDAEAAAIDLQRNNFDGKLSYRVAGFKLTAVYAEIM